VKRYFDNYQDENGDAIAGATVLVMKSDGTLASIYSDNLPTPTPLANPLVTDNLGFFSFYAPNGRYTFRYAKEGFQNRTDPDVDISDAVEIVTGIDKKIADAITAYFTAHPASQTPGPAGVGLPVGGSAGQILKKASNADYVTAWADQQAASGYRPTVSLTVDSQGRALMDNASSNNFQLTLTRDVILSNPANYTSGDRIHLIFQQDSVGGHRFTFDTNFLVIGGTPDFDTTAGLVNRMDFDRMTDGRWVVTPYFLSQPGANEPPATTGGSGGVLSTLITVYPWESGAQVTTDVTMDGATLAAVRTAVAAAATGAKRTAYANAIASLFGANYTLTLRQDGVVHAVIAYNTAMLVTSSQDVTLTPGVVAGVTSRSDGVLANGTWTATFSTTNGNGITLSLASAGKDLTLSGNTTATMGIRPEAITLIVPRAVDGLV
jgi:hypothetical protein